MPIDKIAKRSTVPAVKKWPTAIPLYYDSVTDTLKYYDEDGTALRTLVSADGAQALSNKQVAVLADIAGVNRFIPNSVAKTIVDGAATSLFEVPIAALGAAAGAVFFMVFATDGVDIQVISGLLTYSGVNKAGTITRAATYVAANEAKSVSAGTLTLAFTATDDTNKMTVKVQPTGSLTETTYTITYTVLPLRGTVTIL